MHSPLMLGASALTPTERGTSGQGRPPSADSPHCPLPPPSEIRTVAKRFFHRDSPKACKSLLEFFQASPVRPQRHLLLVAPIQGGCLAARTTSRRPAAARSRTHQRTALVSHLLDLTIALQPALPAGPLHSSDPSGPFASFRSTVAYSQTTPQQRIALMSHLSLDLT